MTSSAMRKPVFNAPFPKATAPRLISGPPVGCNNRCNSFFRTDQSCDVENEASPSPCRVRMARHARYRLLYRFRLFFGMVGFPFQTDDSFVVLHISRKGHAQTTNGMIDDTIDEEGGICHEFAHPCRIRSLRDGPLQDVGFSNSFQKLVKVTAVCDETGFVQVSSATVTRRVIIPVSSRVLVPQNEPVTEINFECSGLLLEHSILRLL